MNQDPASVRNRAVMERVYEDGVLKRERRVQTVADFAEGAARIARREKFRSVLDWRENIYTLEPNGGPETPGDLSVSRQGQMSVAQRV